MSETEKNKLRKVFSDFDTYPTSKQDWLCEVCRRLSWKLQDLRTYVAIDKTPKDKRFFEKLKLNANMSYYVVSSNREFLEKFRVYFTVYGVKNRFDYIIFTKRVSLNDYKKAIDNKDFSIDELVMDSKRLLVYCHKNNSYISDRQQASVQGNLFCSDICDRLLADSKVLILAEYKIDEIENIIGQMRLTKVVIGDNDLTHHGLYKVETLGSRPRRYTDNSCEENLG